MNFNQYFVENNQRVVSFDFDDTIFDLLWDAENNDYERDENGDITGTPNQETIEKIKKHINSGDKVIVVTSRFEKHKQEVMNFLKQHGIPIIEVYCTNGDPKVNTLKKLGVSIHYDDDTYEINDLIGTGIKGKKIKVTW